jgi:hypothetical protein
LAAYVQQAFHSQASHLQKQVSAPSFLRVCFFDLIKLQKYTGKIPCVIDNPTIAHHVPVVAQQELKYDGETTSKACTHYRRMTAL